MRPLRSYKKEYILQAHVALSLRLKHGLSFFVPFVLPFILFVGCTGGRGALLAFAFSPCGKDKLEVLHEV